EVNIPENYESLIDDFIVTNRNIETIDIPVEKKWIGPETEEVTIKLLADGEEKDSLTLTAEDNWEGEFKELYKYDQKTGKEIIYTIEEVEIKNYKSEVDGYTITNTNTETINIPVEKKWIGPVTEEVTIKL